VIAVLNNLSTESTDVCLYMVHVKTFASIVTNENGVHDCDYCNAFSLTLINVAFVQAILLLKFASKDCDPHSSDREKIKAPLNSIFILRK